MTPCVPLSWTADLGIVSGCEGDVMTTATQCLLAYLTGGVVTYGDILELVGDRMLLSSCGFAPFSLADSRPHPPTPSPAQRTLGRGGERHGARILELGYPGFDGIICSCVLKPGKVTFARLLETVGGYRMLYGTGEGVETELRQGRFPALMVKLDGSPERLMAEIGSQHWALCYGDESVGIESTCRMLRVEAVRV
jgi:L-fucose isomerase-like protein